MPGYMNESTNDDHIRNKVDLWTLPKIPVDNSNKEEEPKYLTQTFTQWNNNMNGKERSKYKKINQKKIKHKTVRRNLGTRRQNTIYCQT